MRSQQLLTAAVVVNALAIVLLGWWISRHVGWNSSPSAGAVGFYWRTPAKLKRGQLVEVCLPHEWAQFAIDRGYIGYSWRCPDGAEPLGKVISGMPGDTVWSDPAAVMKQDHFGRPMPHYFGPQHLGPGQIWLHGSAPNSFDSRYFGPVPAANIIADLTPFWVWPR